VSFDPETTRVVRSWLDEGVTQLPDRVLDAVLDQVPATAQRRFTWWPVRRLSTMNATLKFGLAAAVVALAVFAGVQLFGQPNGNVGGPGDDATPSPTAEPTAEPTASSEPSAAGPSSTPWTGLPAGPFVITDDEVRVTVDIASPDWYHSPQIEFVHKDDDGLDSPESVGVALIAWAWPVGTEFLVYGDPCQWASTAPETPATTPAEIAAGFAAQAETDATEPVDVTIGGYSGTAVTLTTPMSYEVPGATREEEFGDCDEDSYTFYGIAGEEAVARNAQGPGQVDELWILDVEGSVVILDATYGPAAPAELVEELRTLAESATFEVP
jgi:hypothetical protein